MFEINDGTIFPSRLIIGAHRARLKTENEDTLTVSNFHVSAPEHESDLAAFSNLYQEFRKVKFGIAMGDFNEYPYDVPFPENWRLMVQSGNVDHIWATKEIRLSDSGSYYIFHIKPDSKKFNLLEISDHQPVICETVVILILKSIIF